MLQPRSLILVTSNPTRKVGGAITDWEWTTFHVLIASGQEGVAISFKLGFHFDFYEATCWCVDCGGVHTFYVLFQGADREFVELDPGGIHIACGRTADGGPAEGFGKIQPTT